MRISACYRQRHANIAVLAIGCSLLGVHTLAPTSASAACADGFGDINADGDINVSDVQCAIIAALAALSGDAAPESECANVPSTSLSDLDCNGAVSIVDVSLAVQLALGAGFAAEVDADADGCPNTCEAQNCDFVFNEPVDVCDTGAPLYTPEEFDDVVLPIADCPFVPLSPVQITGVAVLDSWFMNNWLSEYARFQQKHGRINDMIVVDGGRVVIAGGGDLAEPLYKWSHNVVLAQIAPNGNVEWASSVGVPSVDETPRTLTVDDSGTQYHVFFTKGLEHWRVSADIDGVIAEAKPVDSGTEVGLLKGLAWFGNASISVVAPFTFAGIANDLSAFTSICEQPANVKSHWIYAADSSGANSWAHRWYHLENISTPTTSTGLGSCGFAFGTWQDVSGPHTSPAFYFFSPEGELLGRRRWALPGTSSIQQGMVADSDGEDLVWCAQRSHINTWTEAYILRSRLVSGEFKWLQILNIPIDWGFTGCDGILAAPNEETVAILTDLPGDLVGPTDIQIAHIDSKGCPIARYTFADVVGPGGMLVNDLKNIRHIDGNTYAAHDQSRVYLFELPESGPN